mgnify:CR=1 FL=1
MSGEIFSMETNYLKNNESSQCYGCGICKFKCPVNAINMCKNKKGFLYPRIDQAKCIGCGICERVCPIEIHREKNNFIIYQAASKNVEILIRSQCGGVFSELSKHVFKQNGVVYGAILDLKDFVVKHVRAAGEQSGKLMCTSKYVQSVITSEIYRQLESDLKNKRIVLFTGTPCQCAAIKKNYEQYENLIVCDFICHGVPSPELWERYLKYISEKHNIVIKKAVFRNKRCRKLGNHTESYWSDKGDEYWENDYAALFYSHLAHRDSCFRCQFACTNRYSDITMGGFLEPSIFEAKYDSSMLIVNTEKGGKIFSDIKLNLNSTESKLKYYKNQPCLYHPVPKPDAYKIFWDDWQKLQIKEILDKYATDEIKEKFHIRILKPGEEY